MSYALKAVVAEAELLTAAAAGLPSARTAPLRHGLALLPMVGAFFRELTTDSSGVYPGFWDLPAGLVPTLAEWSKVGPVAYVESEYFGGTGEENTAVWRDGRLALGPLHLLEGDPVSAQGSPVARALRELGIQPAGSSDEFAVAGLDQHRESESWLS